VAESLVSIGLYGNALITKTVSFTAGAQPHPSVLSGHAFARQDGEGREQPEGSEG